MGVNTGARAREEATLWKRKYIEKDRNREGRLEEFIMERKRMRTGIMCKNLFL
jgi:hypothetical protein